MKKLLWMTAVMVFILFVGVGCTTTDNKEVMHSFLDLFVSGQWDRFEEVIAADCVLHYPGGVDVNGLDAITEGWGPQFAVLTDLQVTTLAEIAEGDRLMEFLVFEAVYEGEFMGKQISGVPSKFNQVEMVRIDDGRIVEWWV